MSRYTVAAGHTDAVADCIIKAGARLQTGNRAQVHSCYEAGRDGWWLHRWLSDLGVDNIVVDPASIEVNRRARRAKPDRLDADKLLAMLVRPYAITQASTSGRYCANRPPRTRTRAVWHRELRPTQAIQAPIHSQRASRAFAALQVASTTFAMNAMVRGHAPRLKVPRRDAY